MTISLAVMLICLATSLFMAGLIAFVQVVHYPLFSQVGPEEFSKYHQAHSRRTSIVVILPMTLELISSALLIGIPIPRAPFWLILAGFCAALMTWIATFTLSVPIHNRLGSKGFDTKELASLVRTNWVRFAAWQCHAAIMLAIVGMELAGK